jgi:MFS family permease
VLNSGTQAILLGPALAPLAGGVVATYASWRIMQLIIFAMSFVALICIAVFLPETSHPGSRGVDKLLALEANIGLSPGVKSRAWKWVWLNPFKALAMLRGPNILFVISMPVISCLRMG